MDINNRPAFGDGSPLIMASQFGLAEVVEELILHPQIDVNKPNTVSGETPLFMASFSGRPDVVKLLLKDQRVNVNQADRKGRTPLFATSSRPSIYARYDQRLEVIKLLLADQLASTLNLLGEVSRRETSQRSLSSFILKILEGGLVCSDRSATPF